MSGRMSAAERIAHFLSCSERDPSSECVLWKRGVWGEGYGRFFDGDRTVNAHRFAWELANNQTIQPGLVVMHSCDVRLCVNPAHLSLGTPRDNTQDCIRKGRRNPYRGNRPSLNPMLGEKHPHAKLTDNDVIAIRERVAAGERGIDVARSFGVVKSLISWIVRGHGWKHVGGPIRSA